MVHLYNPTTIHHLSHSRFTYSVLSFSNYRLPVLCLKVYLVPTKDCHLHQMISYEKSLRILQFENPM